ncbi:phosphotransferase [Bacillus sp. 2205SS5-2]|uniref:phosphotransferase n=1 Tax=Bacillus sp. 2205SS5-2 TaxID=3109031 RepID=UPI003007EE72
MGTIYYGAVDRVRPHHQQMGLSSSLLEMVEPYVREENIQLCPQKVLLTGEYTPFNLLMKKREGSWRLHGLIDFADCFLGDATYDLLGPIMFMFFTEEGLTQQFLESYGYKGSKEQLMTYLLLHRFSDLPYYMSKSDSSQEAKTIEELEDVFF